MPVSQMSFQVWTHVLVLSQGRLEARWLDESDCVGAWQSESVAAVVLPTAYTLDALRAIDADRGGQRLMLVFNPQWQTDGQIVSDFGCGCLGCLISVAIPQSRVRASTAMQSNGKGC